MRKVKESAFAEDGSAVRLATNKDYVGFKKELDALDERSNDLKADYKSVYDRANNVGIPRKALKVAHKAMKNPPSDEEREETNRILAACGKAPLFAFAANRDAA